MGGVQTQVYVDVASSGVSIYEGNHRIRAAFQANLDSIPARIRYYGHSECRLSDVPWWYPTNIRRFLQDRCDNG